MVDKELIFQQVLVQFCVSGKIELYHSMNIIGIDFFFNVVGFGSIVIYKGGSPIKVIKIILAVCFAVFLTCGLSNAKMYKYVDENGVVTYQDYPPENISPDTEVEIFSTIKSKEGDLPQKKKKKSKVSPKGHMDEKTDQALKSKPLKVDYSKARVELFVTSWCKYCKMAASYFRSKGVPFTEYDIEKNRAAAKRKDRLSKRKGVPFAIVNGRQIYGFSPGAYENALNNR